MDAASFVSELQAYESGASVFNPWRDTDPALDIGPGAPAMRAAYLERYLAPRMGRARLLLIAEAVGYQGARFSGIAMTSERILLGRAEGIDPTWVIPAGAFQRTSLPEVRPHGFAEPTATIVWKAMRDFGIDPLDFINWNAFPFHPYRPAKGPLTNRTPTDEELADGGKFARQLVAACPQAQVVAVGNKSAAMLGALGIPCVPVRHPANGGATMFRNQVAALLRQAG